WAEPETEISVAASPLCNRGFILPLKQEGLHEGLHCLPDSHCADRRGAARGVRYARAHLEWRDITARVRNTTEGDPSDSDPVRGHSDRGAPPHGADPAQER